MKNLKMLVVGASVLLGFTTAASAEIAGNVSIGTDYVYRGISQTNENPTIQGGFDIASESGFYAGIWGSNVAFAGNVEIDLYAGFSGSFTEDFGFDIGVLAYVYPDDGQGEPDSSFNEIYGSLSFKDFTVGVNYSQDFFYESDEATYLYADYTLGLPNEFGISFHLGNQMINNNVLFGTDDYLEYSIGISKSWAAADWSLTWHDTDLSKAECFGGGRICESRFVFAIGKSL